MGINEEEGKNSKPIQTSMLKEKKLEKEKQQNFHKEKGEEKVKEKEKEKENNSLLTNNKEKNNNTKSFQQKQNKEIIKRDKIKPIPIKRPLKDLLIKDNPSDLIWKYTGKDIKIFPKIFSENCHNENKDENKNAEINENENENEDTITENMLMEHEQKLQRELTELLNKKDLTEAMKKNIESIFIEIQEFYLKIKNDIRLNYPSTNELLKLYSLNNNNQEEKKEIWKKICFYKLLKEQLQDVHLSTITCYRLNCLSSIYNWYNKHRCILFNNQNTHNKDILNKTEQLKIMINDENDYLTIQKETNASHKETKDEIPEIKEDVSEEYDKILKEYILGENENVKNENIENKKDEYNETSSIDLQNYIFPNDLLENITRNEKRETINTDTDTNVHITNERKIDEIENEQKPENVEILEKGETEKMGLKEEKEGKINKACEQDQAIEPLDLQKCNLNDQPSIFFQLPSDIDKIKELEEEINKQKMLIKKKEMEIINSPIGIKFKDIFGNFQDIDLNN